MSTKIVQKGHDFGIDNSTDGLKAIFDKILANEKTVKRATGLTARGVRVEYDSCGRLHFDILLSSNTSDVKMLAKKMGLEVEVGGGDYWTEKPKAAPQVIYVQAAPSADAANESTDVTECESN